MFPECIINDHLSVAQLSSTRLVDVNLLVMVMFVNKIVYLNI